MNFAEQNLTGKASIDKPWLNFYPEQFRNLEIPRITIEAFGPEHKEEIVKKLDEGGLRPKIVKVNI